MPPTGGITGDRRHCAAPPVALSLSMGSPPPPVGILLIVDDSADTREMYATYFRGRGYSAFTAADSREALASAQDCGADLILLDLGLPDLDGWELARRLRGQPGTRHIPIIAVSAHAELSARMRAMSAGVDLFVAKPVTPADLLERVAGFCAERLRSTPPAR
jgi:two-component system, cell cycle response regulator DivK